MEAHGVWKGRSRAELSDGRNHTVVIDLPRHEEGDDAGTSALELTVLSLAGCILTIFPLVARRRRLPFDAMEVHLVGHRGPRAPTVDRVDGIFRLRSAAPPDDVATALRLTVRSCPVGALFERAGVPVDLRTEPL